MRVSAPPLEVEVLFFPNVSFQTQPHDDPESLPVPERVSVSPLASCLSEDAMRWNVVLHVKSEWVGEGEEIRENRFDFDLVAVGRFAWKGNPEEDRDKIAKIVSISGASILYSSLRDMLLTLTARGPWGPYLLPTVRFDPE
jgi:preprotein translocase subunit SecB